MKIIVAGGRVEADYVINSFKESNHTITIINPDKDYASYLASRHERPVFAGDPTKIYVLEEAEINNADIFLALSDDDTDNYIMCMTAKTVFGIKKVVAIVRNPNNVKTFKDLGIDRVINATNLLVTHIGNDTALTNLTRTISIDEDEKVVVVEIAINDDFPFIDQEIKDIKLPNRINVSCIFRDPVVIIPHGETKIKKGDKLLIVTSQDGKDDVNKFFEKRL
ncbi:MAG: potassium channel family protein [Acholeplasmataceae bacterium]